MVKRLVIAEDHALLREGLVRLCEANDFEVVAVAADAAELAEALRLDGDPAREPELAILDVRLPPTLSSEGLEAAIDVRRRRPGFPVVVLSQYVEQLYARELLRSGGESVGYLLKHRVTDVPEFVATLRRVATGATVIDPQVVSALVAGADDRTGLAALTGRERETLELMAQGRSNAGIAAALVVSEKAVGKHISNIFDKLDLPQASDDNRRVLAVLAFLQGLPSGGHDGGR